MLQPDVVRMLWGQQQTLDCGCARLRFLTYIHIRAPLVTMGCTCSGPGPKTARECPRTTTKSVAPALRLVPPLLTSLGVLGLKILGKYPGPHARIWSRSQKIKGGGVRATQQDREGPFFCSLRCFWRRWGFWDSKISKNRAVPDDIVQSERGKERIILHGSVLAPHPGR